MNPADSARWESVSKRIEHARQNEPRTSIVTQAAQQLEEEITSLAQACHFVNAVLKLTHPAHWLPYTNWRAFVHRKQLKLGVPPNEAALFPFTHVTQAVDAEYGRRVQQKFRI
jgi:hypothetical protein